MISTAADLPVTVNVTVPALSAASEPSVSLLSATVSLIDESVTRGVIHKNKADRKKADVTSKLFKLEAASKKTVKKAAKKEEVKVEEVKTEEVQVAEAPKAKRTTSRAKKVETAEGEKEPAKKTTTRKTATKKATAKTEKAE